MRTLVLVLSLAGALAGCAHGGLPAASTPEQARADEAAIRHALADWLDAYNKGDYVRAATVWAPDLIGWYPGSPDDTYALEQQAAKKGRIPDAPLSTFALTIEEVIVEGNLAVVRDTWVETLHRGDGRTRETTIKGFEVWRRQPDGRWKIARWLSAPLPPR